jgi:hypothetical protein
MPLLALQYLRQNGELPLLLLMREALLLPRRR